jgi:hypothetical protein
MQLCVGLEINNFIVLCEILQEQGRNAVTQKHDKIVATQKHDKIAVTQKHGYSRSSEEAIRDFRVADDQIPSTFRLLRVQGLPPWANTSCVSLSDVIQVVND